MRVPKSDDPAWKYVAVGNLAVRRVLNNDRKTTTRRVHKKNLSRS